MNKWENLHQQVQRYQEQYPPGTRIMLLNMSDDTHPIKPHTKGTVQVVDDMGTIHCSVSAL